MFWGNRYSWLRDPFGHMWTLTEIREVLSPEELTSACEDSRRRNSIVRMGTCCISFRTRLERHSRPSISIMKGT